MWSIINGPSTVKTTEAAGRIHSSSCFSMSTHLQPQQRKEDQTKYNTRAAVGGVGLPSFSPKSGAVAFRHGSDHCLVKISIKFIPEPLIRASVYTCKQCLMYSNTLALL